MAVAYPALLALGGAVLAFIPGAPRIVLEPDLALALFVAPNRAECHLAEASDGWR